MGPWERRFRNLLCAFILNAGWVLSNLRPWGPRCFHSPSWRQVTADCGCGPILRETPAGAPTGWKALRCYCGDWWWWRRWPHRGLGCIALRERERHTHTVCFTCFGPRVLCPTTKTVIGQRDSSISLILSNTAVTPTNHLLFDSDSRGQSKQTHWPVRRYLRTSAKAMNCTHALTTAKLPSAHKCYWRPQLHQCEDSPMVEEVVRSFTWQCTQVPHSKSKGRVQTNYQQNVKVVIFQENGPREYYLSDW